MVRAASTGVEASVSSLPGMVLSTGVLWPYSGVEDFRMRMNVCQKIVSSGHWAACSPPDLCWFRPPALCRNASLDASIEAFM